MVERRSEGSANSPAAAHDGKEIGSKREARDRRVRLLAEVDELEVEVDRLVQGGLGLATWRRIPLLIEGAAPEERLRIRLTERHSDYARAEIVAVLRPSPSRVEAPCRFYESCGGCDLQHVRFEEQLPIKVAAALEALRRIGGLEDLPQPELISGGALGYRSRAQLQTAIEPHQAESAAQGDGASSVHIGFRQRGGSGVVDIDECIVMTPPLQEGLGAVRAALHQRVGEANSAVGACESATDKGKLGEIPRRIDVLEGDQGRWVVAPVLGELPRGEVTITIHTNGHSFPLRTHASNFFQGHRDLVGRLVEVTLRGLLASASDGSDGRSTEVAPRVETAWDLYAGVGLFTVPLAMVASRVVAVEGDRGAARNLKFNVRGSAGKTTRVRGESVESFLGKELRKPSERPDLVLLDPPRAGLSKLVRAAIAHIRPQRLRYVSCDPATLARDLRVLCAHYRVAAVTFIDLFSQTSHLECVVALEAQPRGQESSGATQ